MDKAFPHKDLSLEDIRGWARDLDRRPQEFSMLVSRSSMDIFNATIAHSAKPTQETAARLDSLHKANEQSLDKSQKQQERLLAEKYGEDTLSFIKSLPNKKWFLVGTLIDFYLKWEVAQQSDDSEFTDNWYVEFFKGKFNYKVSWANGYDGIDMLEENISQERVLQLINKK